MDSPFFNSLFGTNPPLERLALSCDYEIKEESQVFYLTDSAVTNFFIDSIVTVVLIKFKSLIKTLSEIGGLLVLLKVSLFIAFTHE